jgi:hypothetical protein
MNRPDVSSELWSDVGQDKTAGASAEKCSSRDPFDPTDPVTKYLEILGSQQVLHREESLPQKPAALTDKKGWYGRPYAHAFGFRISNTIGILTRLRMVTSIKQS